MPSMTFEPFHGLNLQDDPGEIGPEAAQDLMNVEFDKRGRLKTRRGFAQFDAVASPVYEGLAPSGDFLLVAGRNSSTQTGITAFDSAGAVVATSAITNSISHPQLTSWARIGTPTTTTTFLAFVGGGTGNRYVKFDNASTLANAGPGTPSYVGAWQNRLVQGGFTTTGTPSGSDGSTSTVFFSDAGAPETFTSTNFIHLSPGDGEQIRGILTWREQLFVFKETAMYVFYGTSVDSTGGAIFNYRRVDLGCKLTTPATSATANFPVVVGRDGIYIAAYEGIYRTTGDVPQKLSAPLDPLFDGSLSAQAFWADDRLIVKGTTAYPWLVWDINTGEWTAWDIPMTMAVGWRAGTDLRERMYFVVPPASGDGRFAITVAHVHVMDPSSLDDKGTAIPWRYQSGWYDPGEGEQALTRETSLWGTGTVNTAILTDYATTDSRAANVTLGTSPVIAEGRHTQAYSGVRFSHKLSGSGQAVIARVAQTVRAVRAAGLR